MHAALRGRSRQLRLHRQVGEHQGCDGLFLEGRFDRVSAFPGERRLIGEL